MAKICYSYLKAELEKQQEEYMQEVIDFINERIDAGVEITILVHPDMAKDKLAITSDPLPEKSHLRMVDLHEEND